MNRSIQTLGKSNQRKLRQFFIEELNLNPRAKIQTIVKEIGATSVDEAYAMMLESYNHVMTIIKQDEQIQKKIASNKKREKKSALKTIVKKLNSLNIVAKYRANVQKKMNAITTIKNQNDMMSVLKRALRPFIGKSIVVSFIVDHATIQTNDLKVGSNFSSWWQETSPIWWVDSSKTIFNVYSIQHFPVGSVYIYPQNEEITPKFLIQKFRDGITNCMLTPIRLWAEDKFKEASSKTVIYRYKGILQKLDDYETKFKNGVPENDIVEVCNNLQIDISVEMPFCENTFINAQSIRKRLKQFRYVNSRMDHVDHNELTFQDKPIEITHTELIGMIKELDEKKEHYTYKKSGGQISSISTLKGTYKVSNEFSEVVRKFEIETGLNFCKIDDVDDKELSAFIREGTNYNETVDFVKAEQEFSELTQDHPFLFIPNLNHIDMAKAYANFKTCQWYSGFLGKITDFRQTDKVEGVGMYRITNLNFDKCRPEFTRYNRKMKIYLDNNVYPSPELTMLTALGATYKIVSGCWGVGSLDFEFNHDMLTKHVPMKGVEKGPSYYAKWTGMCDSHMLEKQHWMKCDSTFFSVIQANCGADVARHYKNGEACFGYTKKHNYHLGHITAFITAYQRMSVIEQLLEIPYESVVRVCVDGIYFSAFQSGTKAEATQIKEGTETISLKNVFRFKDDRNFGNMASNTYVSQACVKTLRLADGCPREQHQKRDHFRKQLHLGPGGCGKTHFNLKDTGLIRPIFIAPSWKLAVSKKRETDINATVWARALTDDPVRISAIKEKANCIIVDEVSMLTENQKKQFFKLYGDMKIIMCGDLGYQLPCIDGVEMTTNGFDDVVRHDTDHRCKDDALRHIKTFLREMIHYDVPRKEINAWIITEFKRLGRCIDTEQLKSMYDVKDMILSGTNSNKDFVTGMFTGKFSEEKYYITDNTTLHQNGEIVIGEKPEKCGCEIRHCFTAHSIQGETAEYNLFIDASSMFDSRMFYTAISRARRLDQIFIVEGLEKGVYSLNGKIYKIVSKSGTYIGSTIESLDVRFKGHMSSFKTYNEAIKFNEAIEKMRPYYNEATVFNEKEVKYITSFALLGDEDARIELVADFPCNSKAELWLEEKRIIQNVVNKTYTEGK